MLEGEVTVRVGDRTVSAAPGSFVMIPRGTVHTFAKAGDTPAKLLVIISPPGFERFFKEVDGVTDLDAVMAAAHSKESWLSLSKPSPFLGNQVSTGSTYVFRVCNLVVPGPSTSSGRTATSEVNAHGELVEPSW